MSEVDRACTFIEKVLEEKLETKFSNGRAVLTTDSCRSITLPIFDAKIIFQDKPENKPRNCAQEEAIKVWKQTGLLLIRDFLTEARVIRINFSDFRDCTQKSKNGQLRTHAVCHPI